MEQYVIGFDIGTGSAKAVAVNIAGKPIAASQVYYKTSSPQPGYSEQNPEIIWKAFVKCINNILSKTKHIPLCVSLSSAMHSLLVIDDKSIPITALITWEDTRSEKIAADLRNSLSAEEIYKSTGTPVHSMSPLCKIKWLKENEPQIFKAAAKFISIKEFIWYRLFNTYEIDFSVASATGLFNIENKEWNRASLQYCGIAVRQLSKPVATNFIRNSVNSSVAKKLKIPPNVKFCIGASDGCLANIGSNATKRGVAALTIGTSGAVRIAGTKPLINYHAMIFNYVLDKKTFISGGPINNGGNVMKWLFKTFLNNDAPSQNDYKNVFKSIESISAGCEGLVFLPYLYGERAPIWDEKATGVFVGIKSFHTNAHFIRAAVEGICFSLKTILEIIENSTTFITQLNVSGGFVHSAIWMQILADVTGKNLCLVQTEDASSIGAALMGMTALKLINNYRSPHRQNNIIIRPGKKNVAVYKNYYPIYKNLYPSLKEYMHELHGISS